MKAYAPFSFLLLTTLMSQQQLLVNGVYGRSFSPFLVPRGGGSGGWDDDGEESHGESASSSSSTSTSTLRERIEKCIQWVEPHHQNLITSIQHRRETFKRCHEMDQKTTLALKDMDMDLFKLSIHTMILPPGLLPNALGGGGLSFQFLHDQVSSLQVDALEMHSILKQYMAMLNESLDLLQTLVDAMERFHTKLKELSKREQRLRWNRGRLLRDEAGMTRTLAEVEELKRSTFERIEELERQAKDQVLKDFMETATAVQKKAKAIDQLVKGINHQNQNHDNDQTPLSIAIMEEEPMEIQVQMTTFHYN